MNKIAIIKLAMEQKTAGVDYLPKIGAACPVCGRKRCKTTSVWPEDDGVKIRYHKCGDCNTRFKSIQVLKK